MISKLKVVLFFLGCMLHSVGFAQINGQIFIVREDQVVLKLAAVSVSVFTESYVRDQFSKVTSFNRDAAEALNLDLMRSVEIANQAREILAKGELSRDIKIKEDDLKKSTREPDYASRYDEYWALVKERAMLEQAVEDTETKRKEVRNAVYGANRLDVFLSYLKDPVYKAKTNADGLFKVSVPRGNYVLFARASRAVLGGVREEYVWLVRVNVRRGDEEVMLSNDNLYKAVGCEECVHVLDAH